MLKRGGKRVGRIVLGQEVLGRRVGKEYLEEGAGRSKVLWGAARRTGPRMREGANWWKLPLNSLSPCVLARK